MPSPQVIFVDANVWFSRTIRDWIGMLYTLPDLPPFHVRWTEDVLAEVIYHLRKKHPQWTGKRITDIRDRLARTFEVGRVDDFVVPDDFRGPDVGDGHVHAAAIACGADMLLTYNTRDFADEGAPYEVLTPDEFLCLVDDATPALVAQAARRMCRFWLERIQEVDLPGSLRRAMCPHFAERVRQRLLENGGALGE